MKKSLLTTGLLLSASVLLVACSPQQEAAKEVVSEKTEQVDSKVEEAKEVESKVEDAASEAVESAKEDVKSAKEDAASAKESAKEEAKAAVKLDPYKEGEALKDGTYTVVGNPDAHGWALHFVMVVKDGKVESADYDYRNEKGEVKSADAEYNKMMADKAGVSFADAKTKLDAALVEKQAFPVEVVSGATDSSNTFNKATQVLLAAAQQGLTDEINLDTVEYVFAN